jgi:hypothetical protein
MGAYVIFTKKLQKYICIIKMLVLPLHHANEITTQLHIKIVFS